MGFMKDLFERATIEQFVESYFNSVAFVLNNLNVAGYLECDHLGCLLHNPAEFDEVSEVLKTYCDQIKGIVLHGRRVRVFKLHSPIEGLYPVPKIEIFEPKADVDLTKLRYGIEHISFYCSDWEGFCAKYKGVLPIAKEGSVEDSYFIKTETINTVEIEFRSDRLGE